MLLAGRLLCDEWADCVASLHPHSYDVSVLLYTDRNPMPTNKSSVSKANSSEIMGEFWDKNDLTQFDDPNTPDVEIHVFVAISIEPDLLSDIEELARRRGIKVETLVNLWLKEKVGETRTG